MAQETPWCFRCHRRLRGKAGRLAHECADQCFDLIDPNGEARYPNRTACKNACPGRNLDAHKNDMAAIERKQHHREIEKLAAKQQQENEKQKKQEEAEQKKKGKEREQEEKDKKHNEREAKKRGSRKRRTRNTTREKPKRRTPKMLKTRPRNGRN
eukprot:TRINITY_DN6774_c0_g1_i1.p2 TRINITY_DN6774_c0_g1~~TRINITY_DN6774_c0_g1_i1.p2  ORF type:complete len:166 (+),score=33.31 TRINITY_DN6774_c0_g1_i1:36-500(+)